MENKHNFFNYPESQTISSKNKTDTHSILFPEIKPKKNYEKKTCSIIRKNLISITKEEIKDSKELVIKSYKEDLDLEKFDTANSLNIINSENYDDSPELNKEELLSLEYSKKKYANKDYSSSNLSD